MFRQGWFHASKFSLTIFLLFFTCSCVSGEQVFGEFGQKLERRILNNETCQRRNLTNLSRRREHARGLRHTKYVRALLFIVSGTWANRLAFSYM